MAEKKEKFQNCWYCTSESCMKNCFDRVVFQDAVCEDFSLWRLYVLVNVSGVFTFSFSYCFYDGFSLFYFFLLFLSAICLLKVFRFDTAILRDPCAVLLLKTLWRLSQGVAFSCLIIFSHVCLQYFPFRAIVTVICWISLEVLLNLVAPLDSAVHSHDFEQINVFWASGFDFISIVFDLLSVRRRLPELYSSHSI